MGKKAKLIQACKDSYNIDSVDNTENEYTYKEQLQDKDIEQEYLIDTVHIIRKELENFVEDNALSLCEYTEDINLYNFLRHVLYN